MSKVPEMKVIPGGNQMSLIRDTEEVTKFLEFAARKNMLDDHGVQCRLSACNAVFALVEEQEDSVDNLLQNLDVFMHRFRVKNKSINDATVRVYKSRIKSSLEDYKAWSADPFSWERSLVQKPQKPAAVKRPKAIKEAKPKAAAKKLRKTEVKEVVVIQAPAPAPEPVAAPAMETVVSAAKPREMSVPKRGEIRISLPIRPDFTAEVILPEDGLTRKEFRRIGAFLFPYCRDVEFGEQVWSSLTQ